MEKILFHSLYTIVIALLVGIGVFIYIHYDFSKMLMYLFTVAIIGFFGGTALKLLFGRY